MKRITFTVINDLVYDQRMQRICRSLANAGYNVTLIGRKLPQSPPLKNEAYSQKRLPCLYLTGKLMYVEFNLRLLLHLFFICTDCFCAIDLDTVMPVYCVSQLRRKLRVYDAHELFTELKEVVTRPAVQKFWLRIEKFALPKFKKGYTVNNFIACEFYKRYGVQYSIVRNLPLLSLSKPVADLYDPFIIYQGAVNEGRCFETLIPAMKYVKARLVICGDGNFFKKVEQIIKNEGVEEKVTLRGMVAPEELRKLTPTAFAAVMLFENTGLNQYQSLANRFFDYIMACVPQVCVDYPQYKVLNDKYRIATLISNTRPETIATALNKLLDDSIYYNTLRQNCITAREELNWQSEEKVLLDFYREVFTIVRDN